MVVRADWTMPGVQSGWAARRTAAAPATCAAASEVPETGAVPSGIDVSTTSGAGATRSGLRTPVPGPRLEKSATCSVPVAASDTTAPAVVTHGVWCWTVPGSGPSLPAGAATATPAA